MFDLKEEMSHGGDLRTVFPNSKSGQNKITRVRNDPSDVKPVWIISLVITDDKKVLLPLIGNHETSVKLDTSLGLGQWPITLQCRWNKVKVF